MIDGYPDDRGRSSTYPTCASRPAPGRSARSGCRSGTPPRRARPSGERAVQGGPGDPGRGRRALQVARGSARSPLVASAPRTAPDRTRQHVAAFPLLNAISPARSAGCSPPSPARYALMSCLNSCVSASDLRLVDLVDVGQLDRIDDHRRPARAAARPRRRASPRSPGSAFLGPVPPDAEAGSGERSTDPGTWSSRTPRAPPARSRDQPGPARPSPSAAPRRRQRSWSSARPCPAPPRSARCRTG